MGRFFLMVTLLFVSTVAYAIDDETTCSVATTIIEAEKPDTQKIKELRSYIERALKVIDHTYGMREHTEILPRMTQDGRDGVGITVLTRCQKRENDTIYQTIFDVYEGVRALQDMAGLNK